MYRPLYLARDVQTLDGAIHRINHYLVREVLRKPIALSTIDSDLSGGYRYPPLEQLGPGEIHLADKSGKGLNSVSGESETVEW